MKRTRTAWKIVLAAVLVYLAWLGWKIGRFHTYRSDAPAAETVPAGLPAFEVEGVYHVHSRFSDGRASVGRIADRAAKAGLRFVILTDHGNPNNASLDAQGIRAGVLVLAGSEISTNRGHLVALGFAPLEPGRTFSREAESASREAAALGGFTLIAHPYSKTRWSWGPPAGYGGMEIIDADTMVKRNALRALPFLPALLIKPTLVLLEMIDPPQATVRKWDVLLHDGPALGVFSADAHFLYSAIFPVFHLHLTLDRPLPPEFGPARELVFEALKRGRFFSAVDAAASARGFRFELQGSVLRLVAPFSFAHETLILRDGAVIRRTADDALTLPVPGPGVYRAEVYLREKSPLRAAVPWIMSNARSYGREIP